jgi:hypothetical protein
MSGLITSTAMAGGRSLPLPTRVNGEQRHADGPCTRPSCHALKKHALGLAQQIEELRHQADALTLERDAMRTALDERISAVDWTPLGGERVMRSLTPTEARICEALLLAGRERSPDDGHDEPPSGEYRTARYGGILRHTWGPEWGIGDYRADLHLIRVNASRLRHKLRAFGWEVVAVFNMGMRLAPWTGEPIPLPPERPWLHSMRVTEDERTQMAALWEGGYRIGYIAAVTGRSADSIRRVLRDARLAVTTPDTERWVGRNRE